MGAKQDKAKDDIESLRSLPLDKQLSMLNGTLNVKNVTAKSMKAALPTLVLFNKSYHPSKDLMMGQPLFNCPSLINTLISKYLTFDGAGDESLKVPALTATIHTLGLLAREDGARYAIIEAEAILLIVSAMNSHPDQADLLEYSLFALGNLSLHSEGKNAIMNFDGVSLISRIMKSHKSSPGVLERACFTLGNLAYHESCKRVILEAGCVEVAVEAAKAHPDASQFLLETCFFFSNMSVIPTGRSLVISLGGLQIVIDAMQRHQTIAELLDLACTAIYNISLDPAGRKLIDEIGALEIVLKSISNNLHAASFLSEAIGSVGRLFLESEQNIIRLIKSKASELILEAKARHEDDATVNTTAVAVLGQLAECEDVHFQTIPAVPTLKELSGRVILNQPTKSLSLLPNDLIEYLNASTQRCDCCGKVWIESRFELISMETLKGFQRKLPVYHQLCSPDCFAKKKNVPENVPVEPSAEPIVQIHAH